MGSEYNGVPWTSGDEFSSAMIHIMEACRDDSAFEWIAKGREPLVERREGETWSGCRLWNLLPDAFEAYAKVLHRIEANYEYVENPLSQEEERILNIPQPSPIRSLTLSRRNSDNRRVRWREIAELLHVPFDPGITWEWFRAVERHLDWPRYLFGPSEGYLEEDEYIELARLLTAESKTRECYYRLAEIPYVATDQPLLFRGNADDVRAIPVQGNWKAPEYWWSAEHDWCVCSDYDLRFTIVAGSRRLIEQVLTSSILEALEVQSLMRVDAFTPMPD